MNLSKSDSQILNPYTYECNNVSTANFLNISKADFKKKLLSYNEFVALYENKLSELRESVKMATNVCLEGGHIYVNESVNLNLLFELNNMAHLNRYLSEQGVKLNTMLFVDDFHPDENIFHLDTYKEVANDLGLYFDSVISEKKMTPLSDELYTRLDDKGLVLDKNGQKILKYKKKPALKKVNGEYTCAMLDSGLTKLKFHFNDAVINVLPDEYKKQQNYMKMIVSKSINDSLNLNTFLTSK